jgi:hypothetical protein
MRAWETTKDIEADLAKIVKYNEKSKHAEACTSIHFKTKIPKKRFILIL